MNKKVYLFDWGDTIMRDFPDEQGAMCNWNKVEMMPNADKMLEILSRKADCYLATNAKDSSKKDIKKALQRVDLYKYFKDIFCFKELGVLKPSEEYFDLILEKLQKKKENVILIGDNLESDIIGVQNIGIDTILYDPEDKYQNYEGKKIANLMMILQTINI